MPTSEDLIPTSGLLGRVSKDWPKERCAATGPLTRLHTLEGANRARAVRTKTCGAWQQPIRITLASKIDPEAGFGNNPSLSPLFLA